MRMPGTAAQCACGGGCPNCQAKQSGQGYPRLQTRQAGSNGPEEMTAPPIVHDVLNSPGQSLDAATQAFMEPRFGRDFSGVRVHTGAKAAESAREINALAYTAGQNVVFDAGQYAPESTAGKMLLAHELTHVAQQSGATQNNLIQRQNGSGSGPPLPSATVYNPGVNHGHAPSGKWSEIQNHPNSDFFESRACANMSPNQVIGLTILWEFGSKPIAKRHLLWYLGAGGGADFVEDTYIEQMLRTDTGIQNLLIRHMPSTAPRSGKFTSHLKVRQEDYANQDLRYAFGAIDRLDFEVDFMAGTLHAWFQDRYEWHPVYPGLYTQFPDDEVRGTNCVHAALVELKNGGVISDFWMKGEATVPLSLFHRAPSSNSGGESSL
jgi:hypothetical protein